jgi:hypothetical protein
MQAKSLFTWIRECFGSHCSGTKIMSNNAIAMTSRSHPIRVDWIDPEEVPELVGRLGLTFAPGKRQGGALSGRWERDLDADLIRLREHYQTDHLVTLLEPHELEDLQIPNLFEQTAEFGMQSHSLAIADAGVPARAGLLELCGALNDCLVRGESVVVHCKGGLGRSGLVAACCVIGLGYLPGQAIAIVRRARCGAVETSIQEQMLLGLEPGWWRAA